MAKPFLKWVGGKGRVIAQLEQYFPKSYGRYFEPFVGGGAVYFYINPDEATINDVNDCLMGTYISVRENVDELIRELKKLQKKYRSLEPEQQKEMFYKIRSEYNILIDKRSLRKSALLIFLNKTCFNGMYRENKKGEFNVPFGKYHNQTICDESNLRAVSVRLKNVRILSGSYIDAVKTAKKGDFIYFDPPYHPISQTSSFTDYSESGFTEKGKTTCIMSCFLILARR